MKQYILTEQMLNGTVTKISIVKAKDFKDAIAIIVDKLQELPDGTINIHDSEFSYSIQYDEGYRVVGSMKDEEINYIERIG